MEQYILAQSPLTTLFCFLVFLFCIVMACVLETENTQYYMAHQLEDWVVMEEFTSDQSQIYKNFNDIESKDEFWQYLEGPFINNLFTEEEGVNELFDGTVLTGAVRLRQIRVDPQCDVMQKFVPKIFLKALDGAIVDKGLSPHTNGKVGCWPSYQGSSTLSESAFGNATRIASRAARAGDELVRDGSVSSNRSAAVVEKLLPECFQYKSGAKSAPISDITTRTIEGWETSYPATGGHICDLPGNFSYEQSKAVIKGLKDLDWVDDGTRTVLLELSIYSTNENIFAYALLMVEFWNTGAVQTYPTIATLIAEDFDSPVKGVFRLVLRGFIYLYVVAFIKGEFNELCALGAREYLCSCWNLIDIMNYGLFLVSFAYWVSLLYFRGVLSGMLHERNDSNIVDAGGNGPLNKSLYSYIDVYGVGVLGEHLNVITAVNCILSSWKLFAYFRASKKLSLLVSTIFRAAETFAFFVIIIMVFLIAYALAFYTAFHNATFHFKSFSISLRTLCLALLSGDTSAWDHEIYISNRYLGPSLLFIFLFVCSTLVLAMMVAIIDDAFMETQHEIDQGYKDPIFFAVKHRVNRIAHFWSSVQSKGVRLAIHGARAGAKGVVRGAQSIRRRSTTNSSHESQSLSNLVISEMDKANDSKESAADEDRTVEPQNKAPKLGLVDTRDSDRGEALDDFCVDDVETASQTIPRKLEVEMVAHAGEAKMDSLSRQFSVSSTSSSHTNEHIRYERKRSKQRDLHTADYVNTWSSAERQNSGLSRRESGEFRRKSRASSLISTGSFRGLSSLKEAYVPAKHNKSRKLVSFKLGKYPKGEHDFKHKNDFFKSGSGALKGNGQKVVVDQTHKAREKSRIMKENKMYLLVQKNHFRVEALANDVSSHLHRNEVRRTVSFVFFTFREDMACKCYVFNIACTHLSQTQYLLLSVYQRQYWTK